MDNERVLATLTPEQAQILPELVKQMIGPIVQTMSDLLKNNTEALNQLASAQQMQNDRLEALEKQIRLNTPVTRQQARYLSAAIKEHALELLDKSSVQDDKAVRKLSGIIKKEALAYYGITALEEIPKHEYSVAMNNVKTWSNIRVVREIVKEAREREKAAEKTSVGSVRPTEDEHGNMLFSCKDDQSDQQTVRGAMGG